MDESASKDTDRLIELRGLIKGVLADGEINLREFAGLDNWLDENPSVADQYPANEIRQRLKEIGADNVVDASELEGLRKLLEKALSDS